MPISSASSYGIILCIILSILKKKKEKRFAYEAGVGLSGREKERFSVGRGNQPSLKG